MISAAFSAGEASMNLIGCRRRRRAASRRSSLRENGGLADVAGEHRRQLDRRLRPLERLGDGRLQQPLAQPDAQLPGEDLDHVLGGQRVAALQQIGEDGALGRGAGSGLDRGEGLGHFPQRRRAARVRLAPDAAQYVGHGLAQVGGAVVGLAERSGRRTRHVARDGRDRRPANARRIAGPPRRMGARSGKWRRGAARRPEAAPGSARAARSSRRCESCRRRVRPARSSHAWRRWYTFGL